MARLIRGIWRHPNGYFYFSRQRAGKRKVIALGTKDEKEAIKRALEIADAPALARSGSLAGEIESFIEFRLSRNEFSRFSAKNKLLTLRRFGEKPTRWNASKARCENVSSMRHR